jgi:hypothetical protein
MFCRQAAAEPVPQPATRCPTGAGGGARPWLRHLPDRAARPSRLALELRLEKLVELRAVHDDPAAALTGNVGPPQAATIRHERQDTNDAERLAQDPPFRMLASRERRETSVALTSTLHWLETDVLAQAQNYHGPTRLNADLIRHAAARSPIRRVTLDIDRYVTLQLAESYLTGPLFRQILRRIERLAWHPT